MISDFFIARPVLANVLAILMVVIGGVAVFALPVAQYPDVVPPTVQVTTRYPGSKRPHRHRYRRLADRAAGERRPGHDLHAVLQRRRRQLLVDGDLQDRRRPRHCAGAGAEPGIERALLAAAGSAGAGRHRAEEFDGDPADRHVDVARRALRQPLPRQLRHHQAQGRDRPAARRGQRRRVRRRAIFDAHLARSEQNAGARAHAPGRDRGVAAAEHASDGGPDRRATGAARPNVPIHPQRHRPAQRPGPIRAGDRQDRPRRRDHAAQ